METKRLRLNVGGDVQGVRYRSYAQKTASKHGVAGTVQNLDDGTVEIVCEGRAADVGAFAKEIRAAEGKGKKTLDGYPGAAVSEVKVAEEEPIGQTQGFRILYGKVPQELDDQMGAAYSILLEYDGAMRKLDQKYGTISVNMKTATTTITLLSGTLNRLATTLEEDRKEMKNLATKMEEGIQALTTKR